MKLSKAVINYQKRFKLSKTVIHVHLCCQKLKACIKMIWLILVSNRPHINRNVLECSAQNARLKLVGAVLAARRVYRDSF